MFPGREMEDRENMMHDLQEIKELNINEECVILTKSKIEQLRNLEIAIARTESENILKGAGARNAINKFENENTPTRNKLGKSDQKDNRKRLGETSRRN